MNNVLKKDIAEFVNTFELTNSLKNSKFLITGATGLIGSTLVHCLLALKKDIEITCPVRDFEKTRTLYDEEEGQLHFIECDLIDYLRNLTDMDYFDYIVHCASPTSGKYMVNYPVDTFMLAVDSTRYILEHAQKTKAKGVVYISSLEYYGQNCNDELITEDMQCYVANTEPRSSYPLGKRAAEYLCAAYSLQYDVQVKVARLTQVFGAGISACDNRVFAQFARSVVAGTDIVMHSKGESAKPYCYTTDCIAAILYILLKGKNGEAYNVANQETYISIRDMAYFLRDNFNPSIKVIIEEHPEMGYAPVTQLNLSSEKLMALGWKPRYSLMEMYARLIEGMKTSEICNTGTIV